MSKIRVAIITDESPWADDEFDTFELNAVSYDLDSMGLDFEIVHFGHHFMDIFRNSYDLLVVDYGGVGGLNPSSAIMQVGRMCDWADEHPGSILLLWTKFTQRIYENELQSQFATSENIWMRYNNSSIESEKDDGLGERLRQWFGFPAPGPTQGGE